MMIVKGRNRDTSWFAAIDSEWPALKTAFERYLDEKNFDKEGRQVTSLSSLTAPLLNKKDVLLKTMNNHHFWSAFKLKSFFISKLARPS